MERCFRGRRPVGEHRDRREDVFTRNAVDLLRKQKWKAPARKIGGLRKVNGYAMDRKWAGVSYKKKTGRRAFFAIDEIVIPPRSVTPLSVQTKRSTLRFVSDIEPPTQTRKVITSYQCNIVTSCCSNVILPHNKTPR